MLEFDSAVDVQNLLDWDAVLDDTNYYELLGVLEIADDAAIKRAFHEFASAFHPDVHLGVEPELQQAARRVFTRGAEAYRVLSHRELRARYDLALAKGFRRLASGEVPQQAALPRGVRSLDDLCKTASGKAHARKSDELISGGDLRSAQRELMLAVAQEGQGTADPELLERLDALDLALFAMGD